MTIGELILEINLLFELIRNLRLNVVYMEINIAGKDKIQIL